MVDLNPVAGRDGDEGTQPGDKSSCKSQASKITSPVNFILKSADPPKALASIGIIELLEADERPVFILDLAGPAIPVVWYNDRIGELQRYNHETLHGDGVVDLSEMNDGLRKPTHSDFMCWARSIPESGRAPAVFYRGSRWTAQTLRNRWRVIAASSTPLDKTAMDYPQIELTQVSVAETPILNENPRLGSTGARSVIPGQPDLKVVLEDFKVHREHTISIFPVKASIPQKGNSPPDSRILGSFDLLFKHPLAEQSRHIKQFLAFDWSSTHLGPITSWSLEMCQWVSFMMSDPRPVCLFWGPHRTMLYNEGYKIVTGQDEPGMLGQPFMDAWGDTAERFDPLFQQGYQTGIAAIQDDTVLYLQENGRFEETYFSFSIIPFTPVPGGEVSFYNPAFNTTRQVIADRRMAFLLRLSQFIALSRSPTEFWQQLVKGLELDHPDLTFAVLYSARQSDSQILPDKLKGNHGFRRWSLEALVRIPESHSNIPTLLINDQAAEDFLPKFSNLIKADSPTLLTTEDGSLPHNLARALRKHDDVATAVYDAALFLPIRSTGDNVLGFLILGLNERKGYDEDYQLFISLLSRQLATSMATACLLEDELRRSRFEAEKATEDRKVLSEKLAIQTQEAVDTETRFRRMADLAPVGMFHIDPTGILLYANDTYYDLTGHPRNVAYPMSWYNVIYKDDHALMDEKWTDLMNGQPINFELRLTRIFEAEEAPGADKISGPTWILASSYPEISEDGSIVGILGCFTDITRLKWAEDFQRRKMLGAVELKRQQEYFIDMTSHEMRNPLSAIFQCADFIATSLSEFGSSSNDVTIPREIMDSFTDSVETIVLCAQHQKRIIDDILTLSKLDSDLLLITPVEVRPISIIREALKMYDAELHESDIELRFQVEPSYRDLNIDWVKLDPSRMLQILINLVSNSIKFTRGQTKRKISIRTGASVNPPIDRIGIEYLPRGHNCRGVSMDPAWGDGEILYLFIEVQDSGRGLNEEERLVLFKRFSQASPRTHVQYESSGLGLYISRELTELQGGQIGIASEAGVGSTFTSFIQARRCSPPEEVSEQSTHPILSPGLSGITSNGSAGGSTNAAKIIQDSVLQSLSAPKHVLVVEDNIVNQKVLCKQLVSAGFLVSVANHGGEALAFLETTRFWHGIEKGTGTDLSVVLMDLEMPIMDGLTCVRRIRELQAEGRLLGHVPIIAITANARSEQIATAKESGMDSVVTKPFRIPDLIPEIEKQIQRGKARRVGGGLIPVVARENAPNKRISALPP